MLKFLKIFGSKTNIINNNCNYCNSYYYNAKSRVLSYSTRTLSSSSLQNLYRRLLEARDPRVSILPILDHWAREETRPVNGPDLISILKRLRTNKRFSHALQLAEWMSERKYLTLSPGDIAVKLDLISKVHGVGDAESYFRSIPDTLRTFKVYGALLNCYAEKRLLDQAESLMQEMRSLGYNTTLSCDVMLNLYAKLRKYEKLHNLFQEMEETGISCGKATFCILLNAYADSSNLEGMEKILAKIEDDLMETSKWNFYLVAAKGYLKAGLAEKTSEMLKKAEKLVSRGEPRIAYLLLLSMYAGLGNQSEVHRIWNLYKPLGCGNNVGYMYMVSALIKLDNIDEAEKIFEEWESVNVTYDFRIPNLLINAYTKKNLLWEAETVVFKAIDRGKEPPASSWDLLATGYYKNMQFEKAVETMQKAIWVNQDSWRLNQQTLAACSEYLKEKGNIEKATEFAALLTERKRGLNPHKSTCIKNIPIRSIVGVRPMR